MAEALSPLTELSALQLHGNTGLGPGLPPRRPSSATHSGAAASASSNGVGAGAGAGAGAGCGYVATMFAALPALELCDGQERAQVLVLAPGAPGGDPQQQQQQQQPINGAANGGGRSQGAGAEGGGVGGSLDPTFAEMEAFRQRLGIKTYAPQFQGRPGSAAGNRPGTASGRPGSAGGRPGTAGGRPGTGALAGVMVAGGLWAAGCGCG